MVPATVTAAPSTPSYVLNPVKKEVGSQLRTDSLEAAKAEGRLDLAADAPVRPKGKLGIQSNAQAVVGTVTPWLVNDSTTNRYSLKNFTLRAIGTYGEVWVANDLNFPGNDPRNEKIVIGEEQVNYLLNEFDTKMYEKEVQFFGAPKERKGADGYNGWYNDDTGRVVILVNNIRDENFYDPTYPSYVVGYFSNTISDFSDRNIMTIDAYNWPARTGAAGNYLYEGTFAHEFQHLLHRDTDDHEENFINEGMSDFAQYLTGYGHSVGHVNFYMNNLKNSLNFWGDQGDLQILSDYGNSYLFQLYLYEQFGETFIRELFRNQLTGIDSINDTFQKLGINKTFADVYADFTTALLVDGRYQGKDTYKFNSIDLSPNLASANALEKSIPSWGTDFKIIDTSKKIDHLYFKGIDFLGSKWSTKADAEKGQVVWGNAGDEADNTLIRELDLTGVSNPTLSFDTKYDIEEQWDFGIVQVSTDEGKTWTSLSNANTRSDIVEEGYPKIKANVPGFTGNSGGWVSESFDLSAYAGKKVLVSFRYMTDWGTNNDGWLLANLKLNDQLIDPMSSTDGFKSIEQVTKDYVNYQVQFVGIKKEKHMGKEGNVKVLRFNDLLNMSESDRLDLKQMLQGGQYEKLVMATTYAAPVGKPGAVPYDFTVVNKKDNGPFKR